MPFDSYSCVGFIIIVTLNTMMVASSVYYYIAFAGIYTGIGAIIEACIDDISLNKSNLNVKIDGNLSIRNELKQLIELHCDLYR